MEAKNEILEAIKTSVTAYMLCGGRKADAVIAISNLRDVRQSHYDSPYAELSVRILDLPVKLKNILVDDNEIKTVAELAARTKESLLILPGVRHTFVSYIERELAKYGLKLKDGNDHA
jgi:DNA-directed RNA polymerase alpha subunit